MFNKVSAPVVVLLLAAPAWAGKHKLDDSTITTPVGPIQATEIRYDRALGLSMVKGKFVNSTEKNWRNLKITMLLQDKNGAIQPDDPSATSFTVEKLGPGNTATFRTQFRGHVDEKTVEISFRYQSGENPEFLLNPVCPIQILKADPLAVVFGTADPWGWELKITYKNVSDKTIVAEKFGAKFFDVVQDSEPSVYDYMAAETVVSGQVRAPHWKDGVYVHELGMRLSAAAWPIKLLFSDGSSWQDDGSAACASDK